MNKGMVIVENLNLSPGEIVEKLVESGRKKTGLPAYKLLLLGILAGAYIAFAAAGSNAAIHTIESAGIAKTLAGALFSAGLMMVVITGAELFTGNALIIISCLEKQARWIKLLKNWLFVYAGNFIGAIIIVFFVYLSGQYNFSDGMLGGYTVKVAAGKTGLSLVNAFFMGVLCNWLVCMAVVMSNAARDTAGKLLAIFFPIWLFITSGFEHSIANMYYIPTGIIAKAVKPWADQALSLGVTESGLNGLTWGAFITKNLIPVTLGNIVGGTLFVGVIYWASYLYKGRKSRRGNRSVEAGFAAGMDVSNGKNI